MSSHKPDKRGKPGRQQKSADSAERQVPLSLTAPLTRDSQPKVICEAKPPTSIEEGGLVKLSAKPTIGEPSDYQYHWSLSDGSEEKRLKVNPLKPWIASWDTTGLQPGHYEVIAYMLEKGGTPPQPKVLDQCEMPFTVVSRPLQRGDSVNVSLQRARVETTPDLPLWVVIQRTTQAISFKNYQDFVDLVLCNIGASPTGSPGKAAFTELKKMRFLPYNDTDAYRLLKVATEAFLMVNCGVTLDGLKFTQADVDEVLRRAGINSRRDELDALWDGYLEEINGSTDATLPYLAIIRKKLSNEPLKTTIFTGEGDTSTIGEQCVGILRDKFTRPCLLELIWSYWIEQAMVVQTLNAITLRFQNVRRGDRDPLSMMEIDPLRPLGNLFWGLIGDEPHRLTLPRRVLEYRHEYGLTLDGKAVPAMRPADNRSKFLEAFHNLLYLCTTFFHDDDDTTRIADAFPVLNALREVHYLLAEGAHNQFGDLPSTARQEMLIQQWLLARPEFREFLPTRTMVALPEAWMDRVDAMKTLQGWPDVSVLHFNRLAVFGERLLLSIRFGAWGTVESPAQAANWARFFRTELRGYMDAYRAVTGVDLTAEITDSRRAAERYVSPSVHLRNRLEMQRRVR